MTDEQFIRAFEQGTLVEFHHSDHIRMAWCYLRRYGVDEGTLRIVDGIRSFAVFKKQKELYHETITQFWISAVAHHMKDDPGVTFADFCREVPPLLDSKLIFHYYSRELLQSVIAKSMIVPPDVWKLPFMMMRSR